MTKFLKLFALSMTICAFAACTPKTDVGTKYLGHWVQKKVDLTGTVALDIANKGEKHFEVTEYRTISSDLPNSKRVTIYTLTEDKLELMGHFIYLNEDGSLKYNGKDFIR